ncbi:N6-adenosine-methyltransferase catalytic subunit-like [Hydractinia symbiolongicarpus]|uniref:N6-adenosine-methyltransferase catalytic subunit-like n=1 Tax=Hydractinia symbiolongicarpus TaxID=13093 RepID=UPI00254F7352|nr:N6-adenosine-methyltransferase catalytic subunit-like [Hydractinia symbiolongicarpus]
MSESDTWAKLQDHKRKHINLKERLAKRRKERQGLLDPSSAPEVKSTDNVEEKKKVVEVKTELIQKKSIAQDEVEKLLPFILSDKHLRLPISVEDLIAHIQEHENKSAESTTIIAVLDKLEAQNLLSLKRSDNLVTVMDCEFSKLKAVHENKVKTSTSTKSGETSNLLSADKSKDKKVDPVTEDTDELAALLSMPTSKETENKKLGSEILNLLNQPTAKEQSLVEKFKSEGGAMVREFCPFGTREECHRSNTNKGKCKKLHFRKIIQAHTDEHLGDCSFLNTCFHMDTCKYVHYEVDTRGLENRNENKTENTKSNKNTDLISSKKIIMTPPQWLKCDVRYLDFEVLGKFSVVMADPPWDIHMELPYGTMSDHEMKGLPISKLQDHGYIFLWVTGRAIELGRECLQIWGYKRCDELIWVKTNQLQRLIRTGRTGHWINHGKEHCIIGVKGNPDPSLFNKGLDCDVLVSEVRDTSHKPDEVYGLIERLAPGQRKVELFGRMHNVQPNWVTLGNQLSGVNLIEPDVVKRFKERYPNGIEMGKPQNKPIPTVIDVTPQQGGEGTI